MTTGSRLLLLSAALVMAGCADSEHAEQAVSTDGSDGVSFSDATQASGVQFQHHAGRTELKLLPEIMGSGVAIADFNRDGAPDLILVNGGDLNASERAGIAVNKLYINDGKGNFRDASSEWLLPSRGYGMGVAVGDYDNDGYVDLFLTHFDGDDRLLRNSGDQFVDVTVDAGLQSDGQWSTSAGFFDYDRDGHLDLYQVRYLKFSIADAPKSFRNQLLIYPTPLLFEGVADRVWKGTGAGNFNDVSEQLGLHLAPSKGLALAKTLGSKKNEAALLDQLSVLDCQAGNYAKATARSE